MKNQKYKTNVMIHDDLTKVSLRLTLLIYAFCGALLCIMALGIKVFL